MIYLRIKQSSFNRFTPIGVIYPSPYGDPVGDNIIPLSYVTNAHTDINGKPLWEFVHINEKLDREYLLKISDTEYRIDFRIGIVKKNLVKKLRRHVSATINNAMSPIKWQRYFEFYRLHEKGTLTVAEQYIYNIELHGRPEAQVWSHVGQKIKWFYDCIARQNQYEDIINNETNIRQLAELNLRKIQLPEWTI